MYKNNDSFRTDLADERRELYKTANNMQEVQGIKSEEQQFNDNIKKDKG